MIIISQTIIIIGTNSSRSVTFTEPPSEEFKAVCPDCGWTRGYPTPTQQKRALAAHQRFCDGPPEPRNLDVGGRLSEEVALYFGKAASATTKKSEA